MDPLPGPVEKADVDVSEIVLRKLPSQAFKPNQPDEPPSAAGFGSARKDLLQTARISGSQGARTSGKSTSEFPEPARAIACLSHVSVARPRSFEPIECWNSRNLLTAEHKPDNVCA